MQNDYRLQIYKYVSSANSESNLLFATIIKKLKNIKICGIWILGVAII